MITQIELEVQAVEAAPGAQLVTDLADTNDATHRFLVTLVNRTGDELPLDVLTIGDGFAHLAGIVRPWLQAEGLKGWGIYEVLPTWEASF
jgi:hypothetical protein